MSFLSVFLLCRNNFDSISMLQVELDGQGYIVLKEHTMTSVPGVFACGDVADTRYKWVLLCTCVLHILNPVLSLSMTECWSLIWESFITNTAVYLIVSADKPSRRRARAARRRWTPRSGWKSRKPECDWDDWRASLFTVACSWLVELFCGCE